MKLLLDRDPYANKRGRSYLNSALNEASARGHEQVVKLLLDRGCQVNPLDVF